MPRKLTRKEELIYIQKAASGDLDAWCVLYEAYYERVFKFILAWINPEGRKSPEKSAEDLANKIFGKVYKQVLKGKYNPKFTFFTFIYNFGLKNTVIKYFKKLSRYAELSDDDDSPVNREFEIINSTNAGVLPQDYWAVLSLICLTGLKPHQILVFLLSAVLKWKYSEIILDFGNTNLHDIADRVEKDYIAYLGMEAETTYYKKYFTPLFKLLDSAVNEIYKEREYKSLRENYKTIGEIPLEKFCTNITEKKFENRASDWCYDAWFLLWEVKLGIFDIGSILEKQAFNYEPHKILAYICLNLMKLDRKSITSQYGKYNFRELFEIFSNSNYWTIEESIVRKFLAPLNNRLNMKFGDVYTAEEYVKRPDYEEIKSRITGDLKFDDFFAECGDVTKTETISSCLKKWGKAFGAGVYKSYSHNQRK